jgi:hypothetical protein
MTWLCGEPRKVFFSQTQDEKRRFFFAYSSPCEFVRLVSIRILT